ncbi:MAG: transporter substrate-binding domain-containing protein [Bacillota bacterium]
MRAFKSSKKAVALALALILAVGLLAGCASQPSKPADNAPASGQSGQQAQGDQSLQKVKDAGKIVFATDSLYPPMEYMDDKNENIIGFDMDLAAEIAKRLGVAFKAESVAWDGLLPGLQEGKYDAVISSMNVTDERKEKANFVSYVSLDQVFVVRPDATPVTKLDELAGKVVAVQKGTTSEEMAQGIKGVKSITSLDAFDATFIELRNKKADVIVIDEPVGLYFVKKDPATYKISGKAAQAMPVGIAIRKDAKALTDAVQKAVDDIKKDGTFKTISEKWFGVDLSNQ